jgi:predicted metal-dependent hydrolase
LPASTRPARAAPDVQSATAMLAGRAVTYTVRRSPRARQVSLRVLPAAGLEVVVPARGRLPDIAVVLRQHTPWILRTIDRVTPANQICRPLEDGASVPYRGDAYRLCVVAASVLRPVVTLDEASQTLIVRHNPVRHELALVLAQWYRQQARIILTGRANYFAARLGVSYQRLAIRDPRSRWGSCSAAGGLNFSWRLVLAPPAILDYVVIHELAHCRELNHSARFWTIVAAHCPAYRAERAWLRTHGGALLAFLCVAA